VVAEAGHIDILVVNQAVPGVHSASDQIDDSYWNDVMLSCPTNTMWYVRAVLRQMLPRKSGKIVAVTSGAAIYGAPQSAAYACGRGAQNVFLSTVAHEVASDNVIINVIALNIVKNPTFWSDKTIDTPYIREMLRRDVPAGRFAEGWETADLAVFLASDRNNFMSGQVLEFTGGWVTWSRDEMGRPWGDNAARGQTIRER
jgi:NAD(P)-dependent dehydrogenase (short-subunit alcohol dehydrogenase family)